MKVLLKLFDMTKPAADGSEIPRSSVEKYLQSDDYKRMMEEHLALGGVTHKDRKVESKYQDIIAQDDQILVSNNATHYITRIFLKDNDPFCYCEVQILDPENYSGERKEKILNLMADLKSGIMLPCSVVIQALWSYQNVAEKIVSIKGVDFTLGPSFAGSGTIKVFSKHILRDSDEWSPKKDGEASIAVFSMVSEVLPTDAPSAHETEYTPEQVAKKYGRASKAYAYAKSFSKISSEDLQKYLAGDKDELEDLIEDALEKPSTDRVRLLLLKAMGNDNVKLVDNFMKVYKDDIDFIIQAIPGSDGVDPDLILTQKLDDLLRREPRTMQFSTVNSVRDRMMFSKYPRYSLINRIIKSYKTYYEQHQASISESELEWLKLFLVQDINTLLKNVVPYIMKGRNLNGLYALVQFNEDIQQAGDELSKIYREVLVSEKVLGFVPEAKYKKWKLALLKFMSTISEYTYGIKLEQDPSILDTISQM